MASRDVDRLLRGLFIRRALESDREPASIAEAFGWAYEEVQRRMPVATSRISPEDVDELVHQNWDWAADMSVQGIDVQRPGVIEYEHEVRHMYRREVNGRFGDVLDDLCVLRAAADQCCESFHVQTEANADLRVSLLIRLAARGMLIADEIQHLLTGGYSGGALGRWRSLHEVSVVAAILAGSDELTAERYAKHEVIGRAKAIGRYEQHRNALGEPPLDQEIVKAVRSRRAALIAEYGTSFKNDYGWADHLAKERVTFLVLEQLAGRDWLRPHYELANHPIHAGSRNLINEIGVDDDQTLLTGPSAVGLHDPIQLTAHSLVFLVEQLLCSDMEDGRWLGREVQVNALKKLAERIVERLPELADETDDEAVPSRGPVDVGGPLPSLLAWPDIAWEEIGSEGTLVDRWRLRSLLRGSS